MTLNRAISGIARASLLTGVLLAASPGCRPTGTSDEQRLLEQQRRRELEKIATPKPVAERLCVAKAFFDDDNTIEAKRELDAILVAHPDHVEAQRLRAELDAKSGNVDAAIARIDSVAMSPQEQCDALWAAAGWLVDANQLDAAEQRLREILDRCPNQTNFRVHRKLASLLNQTGRRREAAEQLFILAQHGKLNEKEVYALNTLRDPYIDLSLAKPDFQGATSPAALAQARRLHGDGQLTEAERWAKALANTFPESAPIVAFEGLLYAELQRFTEMNDWLGRLPADIADEPEYWYALGLWLQHHERHSMAVRSFSEAILRDPTDRFSFLRLAESLHAEGEPKSALAAKKMFRMLRETSEIAREFGVQSVSAAKLDRMAELLEQLNRPFESIAWRKLAHRKRNAPRSDFQQLDTRRERLLAKGSERSDDKAILDLVSIKRSEWPLPTPKLIESIAASAEDRDDQPKRASSISHSIVLADVAKQIGLSFRYENGDDPRDDRRLLHQMTGGGIGVLDYDLDGWPDLYLTQAGGDAFDSLGSDPNQLFRNQQGVSIKAIASQSKTDDRGYGQGVSVADFNQDGFPDLAIANIGHNVLYLNQGDGTFRSKSMPQIGQGGWTTSIVAGDLSGDHLPELVEINYVDDPSVLEIYCTRESDECNPSEFRPAVDRFLTVTSAGTVQPWQGPGAPVPDRNYGFGGVIASFTGRHPNQLFVANDTRFNQFWVSHGQADAIEFQEAATILGCSAGSSGQPNGCMGIATGDFDRNGTLDLHVTNYWNQPAELYLMQPSGVFANRNAALGLFDRTRETVGWGTQAVDFDHDGWLDLIVLNGHVADRRNRGIPFRMHPQLFAGSGSGFRQIKPKRSRSFWKKRALGRAAATLDFNRDHKVDVVVGDLDQPYAMLENQSAGGNALRLKLIGTSSERDAVGAKVVVTCDDQQWTAWQTGGGFLCSNENVIHFGVGQCDQVDSLEISWPSGKTTSITNTPVNQMLLVVESHTAPIVFE